MAQNALIGPTPRNALLGMAADGLAATDRFLKRPAGDDRSDPMRKLRLLGNGVAELLGLGDIATTVDRASYGLPQTRGTGMATQLLPEARNALLALAPQAAVNPAGALRTVAGLSGAVDTGLGRAIFMGAGSRTWDKAAAAKAEQMLASGADPKAVWRETGTFRSPDGMLRQEIDDSGARYLGEKLPTAKGRLQVATDYLREQGVPAPRDIGSADSLVSPMLKQEALQYADMVVSRGAPSAPLGTVLQHGKTFMSYPEMGAIPLSREISGRQGLRGTYSPEQGSMTISGPTMVGESADATKSTLLHELQHAIQQREDFARGGNPEMMKAENSRLVAEAIRALEAKADAAREAGDKAAYMAATDARAALMRGDGYGGYKLLAGEAEARAVQARMNMNPQQRREVFPLDSYDVPINQLIVRR